VSSEFADLHLHTVASDGTDTVQQRVEDAKKSGLKCIAITDHDIVSKELGKQRFRTKNGVEVITGAEIKSEIKGTKIEILGYFLDPTDQLLQSLVKKNKEYRRERMKKMIKKVNTILNSDIGFDELRSKVNGNVGRPHLAQELVDNGLAKTQNEVFQKYIGTDCECYVSTQKIDAKKVIRTIHQNGGVTVLAHPGRNLDKQNAGMIVEELIGMGLDGIEVAYTYRHKIQDGYKINFTEVYSSELAEKNDLLISGGSDCHGQNSNKYNIGKIKLPYRRVKELRERAKSYRN